MEKTIMSTPTPTPTPTPSKAPPTPSKAPPAELECNNILLWIIFTITSIIYLISMFFLVEILYKKKSAK
mgnify:CR=1 FL=1